MPLGTLVRLPGFKELRCPRAAAKPCLLVGSNLFLAASFSATQAFDDPVEVPPDFTGTQIVIPHTTNGVLYLKLRDDPATVQTLTMTVTPAPPMPADTSAVARPKPAGATAGAADPPLTAPNVSDTGGAGATAAADPAPALPQ
jgi:hypothetical protein